MSQCLYAHNNSDYDDSVAVGWQTAQVSTFSIMNFSGRILIGKYCSHILVPLISVCIGLVSDYTKNKYGMSRSYSLTLVAVLFFISQIVTGSITNIAHLWISSALVGLAFGSVYSLFPTICLEWFGMRKCSLFLPLLKYWSAILNQRTSLRTGAISLCHLLLASSSLFYLGGTLTHTGVLQSTMLQWTLLLSMYILLLLNVCLA